MKKYYCDRCGTEINLEPLKMRFLYGKDLLRHRHQKMSLLTQSLEEMDFCEKCLEQFVNFAQNNNVCDECVQQMMDENTMLREMDEEVGPDTYGEMDPDEWNNALKRMSSFSVCSGLTAEGL